MQQHVDAQNGSQRKNSYYSDVGTSSAGTMSPVNSFFSPSTADSGWSPISALTSSGSSLMSSLGSSGSRRSSRGNDIFPVPPERPWVASQYSEEPSGYFTPKPPSFARPEGTFTRRQYKAQGGKRGKRSSSRKRRKSRRGRKGSRKSKSKSRRRR